MLVFGGDYHKIWGININSVSKFEKECIIECHKRLTTSRCNDSTLNTVVKLVNSYPHLAEYKFLCALCYRDILFAAAIKDKRRQFIFLNGHVLQNDYNYYYQNSQFYLEEALKIMPTHPIFLYFYSLNFDEIRKESLCFKQLDKIRALLQHDEYAAKWMKHEQIPCYDAFECQFQFFYTHSVYRDKNLISRVWKHINDLFPKYIILLNKHIDIVPLAKWMASSNYSIIYSSVGKYKHTYKVFKFRYGKYDRVQEDIYLLTYLEACVHSCFAVNKYSKCANMLEFLFRYTKSQSVNYITALYGYLYRLVAEIAIYNSGKQKKIQLRVLNKYVAQKLKNGIPNEIKSNIFQTVANATEEAKFAFMCIGYCKTFCTISTKLDFDLNNVLNHIHMDGNKCGIDKIEDAAYILGMMQRSASTGVELHRSIRSFFTCLVLAMAGRAADKRLKFLKPDIPLSYYYSGLNAVELKQYQIAIKLFKKAYRITKDVKIISKNYKKLIKKCREKLVEQTCDYCGDKIKKLKSCKGCAMCFYCSKRCQKMDWKVQNHRNICSKFWVNVRVYTLLQNKWHHLE
eukprot:97498_1